MKKRILLLISLVLITGSNIESDPVEKIWVLPTISVPIPTLTQWGLIAMVVVLGIVGFMVIRRRKVTA